MHEVRRLSFRVNTLRPFIMSVLRYMKGRFQNSPTHHEKRIGSIVLASGYVVGIVRVMFLLMMLQ